MDCIADSHRNGKGIAEDHPIMRHRMNLESVATYEGAHVSHALIIVLAIAGIPAFRQLAEGTATHGFVTRHDFSRAANANHIAWA